MKVSVIIPSFNEGPRILPIIKAVKSSALVSEIIVVDDGSDQSSRLILSKIKGVRLLTHHRNLGKSAAMKTGLLASSGSVIVYVDADLHNFSSKHLDLMVRPLLSGKFDYILGEPGHDGWFKLYSGLNASYTGERAVFRRYLLQNLDLFKYPGYQIEAAMNQRFLPQLRCAKVRLNSVFHYSKYSKNGLYGLYLDYDMTKRIISGFGLLALARQVNAIRTLPYLNLRTQKNHFLIK